MTNKLPYVTLVDPMLDHQVVFHVIASHIIVSCNCRRVKTDGADAYESMGRVDGSLPKARLFYNDPSLHTKPFGEEDKAKW